MLPGREEGAAAETLHVYEPQRPVGERGHGSDQFPRIRLGVGKKPHPDYNLADWVLSRFTPQEQKDLSLALDNAAAAAELMVAGNTDKAMNLYNS